MKLASALLLFAALGISLRAEEPKLVVTTGPILQDIVRQIGGDAFRVENLVPAGTKSEDFEPPAETAALLKSASLLIVNGAGYEPWLDDLVKKSGYSGPTTVATHAVPLFDLDGNLHKVNEDESLDSPDAEFDPFAWHNPRNVVLYVENIRAALADLQPSERGALNVRASGYVKLLASLQSYAEQQFGSLPANRKTIVTPHVAFRYLADAFGFRIVSFIGVSSGRELIPEQQARIIEMIGRLNVPAVFFERTANPKMMAGFARETGVKMITSLYTDELGPPNSPAATYLGMFRANVDTIVNALKPPAPPAPPQAASKNAVPPAKATAPAGR